MVQEGPSLRCAVCVVGTTYSNVHRAVKRFQETNSYTKRPVSGPKRETSEHYDRFVVLQILRDRHVTAVQARNRLQEVRQVNVSENKVTWHLYAANLHARRPITEPFLMREHCVARLQFFQVHQNWTMEEWGAVLFTDESRFWLMAPDGRERVWRRQGERFEPCTFSARTPFHGG